MVNACLIIYSRKNDRKLFVLAFETIGSPEKGCFFGASKMSDTKSASTIFG